MWGEEHFTLSLLWASNQNEGLTWFPATETNIQHREFTEFTVKATIIEIHLAEPQVCSSLSEDVSATITKFWNSMTKCPNVDLNFPKPQTCRGAGVSFLGHVVARLELNPPRRTDAQPEPFEFLMYVVPVPKNVGPNQNSIIHWVHVKMSTREP